ncbi:MAG: hypothetical protein K0V04_17075, partial [Deltaproteobacteria bacterium]|nr:hypothetical protein [Deltaproteobacteria bacterium]
VLLAELRDLRSEDQNILVQRFFGDKTAAEIGRSLGVPAATIRSRIHRALERLRGGLDRGFGERRTWCAAVLAIPAGGGVTLEASATSKPTMSTAAPILVVSAAALGVGAYAYATTESEPTPQLTPEATPVSAAPKTTVPRPAPVVQARSPKGQWEARRAKVRGNVEVEPTTAETIVVRPSTAALAYDELVRACLKDLDSKAVGAMTVSIHEIGAPDVGTIYDDVDVVYSSLDDQEALECVVQSMCTYVGAAPEAPLDLVVLRTMALGNAETREDEGKQVASYIVAAKAGKLRACESEADGEAAGTVAYAMTIGEGGLVEDSVPGPSALPAAVIDCITTTTTDWRFPAPLAGQTFTHASTRPIPITEYSAREDATREDATPKTPARPGALALHGQAARLQLRLDPIAKRGRGLGAHPMGRSRRAREALEDRAGSGRGELPGGRVGPAGDRADHCADRRIRPRGPGLTAPSRGVQRHRGRAGAGPHCGEIRQPKPRPFG